MNKVYLYWDTVRAHSNRIHDNIKDAIKQANRWNTEERENAVQLHQGGYKRASSPSTVFDVVVAYSYETGCHIGWYVREMHPGADAIYREI